MNYMLLLYSLDINECKSSPCKNGGKCSDHVNRYTCSCAAGYNGVHCENGTFLYILMINDYQHIILYPCAFDEFEIPKLGLRSDLSVLWLYFQTLMSAAVLLARTVEYVLIK